MRPAAGGCSGVPRNFTITSGWKKPALFSHSGNYGFSHMSRSVYLFCALLVISVIHQLPAQVTLRPSKPESTAPAPPPASRAVTTASRGVTPPAVATPADPNTLKFDAESKEYNAKPGEVSATFSFNITNVSKAEVKITALRMSCGCTVAHLPPLPDQPFVLSPGSNVSVGVTMDLRGKMGAVTKTLRVESSAGFKPLLVRANIPPGANPAAATPHGAPAILHVAPAVPNVMGDRAKNIQSALADRQAVFKGDCAKCHVDQGVGKLGKELYMADCAICHDAEHRAAMVTDLRVPREPRDLAYWQKWITEGKTGTMMPAFAAAHGGPLTQEQVDSLTVYLYANFPKNVDPKKTATKIVSQPVSPSPVLQKK